MPALDERQEDDQDDDQDDGGGGRHPRQSARAEVLAHQWNI
jgi:hypothetical protein